MTGMHSRIGPAVGAMGLSLLMLAACQPQSKPGDGLAWAYPHAAKGICLFRRARIMFQAAHSS